MSYIVISTSNCQWIVFLEDIINPDKAVAEVSII